VLAGGLFPWILRAPDVVGWLRRRRDPAPEKTFLVVWPLVVLVFFSLSPNKASGYVLPAVPPLAVAAGIALTRLERGPALRLSGAGSLLLAAGLLVAVLSGARPPALAGHEASLPTALVVGLSILAVLGLAAATGRPRASLLATLLLAAATMAGGLFLVAPIRNRERSLRAPGRAAREYLGPGTRFVNLEGDKPGLLWYADHPVESGVKMAEAVRHWNGPVGILLYLDRKKVSRLAERIGRPPRVVFRMEGRRDVLVINRAAE
jgi:hypothetical protein